MLYIGVIRWNRQRKLKNPDTGRSAYRLNQESEWIRSEAPELRIVPQELWGAAKARQDELTALYKKQIDGSRAAVGRMKAKNGGLNATQRPRTLLSGLLFCGCCGGSCAGAARTAMPAPTMYLAMAATTPAPWTARLWKAAC